MDSPRTAPTRFRYFVLAILCSLAFLTYLDRICIMRAQGDIARDLRFDRLTPADEERLSSYPPETQAGERARLQRARSTERMGWVFSAFVAGYLLFEVPGGWLGDRWGARAVIFRIVLGWSLFTAATGSVKGIISVFSSRPTPEQWWIALLVIRFLFGIGEAGAYPNIARALGRWFPFRERATAQSFIWLSSRLGGAVAPAVLGGLILVAGGWQRAFWILGLGGIAWAALFLLWFRDRPEDEPRVNRAERELIRGKTTSGGTIYDDSPGTPVPWRSLVSPNVLALCLASFCVSFCFYFYITFLPQYLKDQFQVDFHQSQVLAGLPLLFGGFACLAGGVLSDVVTRKTANRRWGRSLVPIIAWSLAGGCAFAVPQCHTAQAAMALLVLGFFLQDLGVPPMWSLPADIGGRFAGTLGGWMNTAGALGGMLSPLVAARVSITLGWNSAFVLFGAVYLLGALAWLRVDAARPLAHSKSVIP